MQEEKSYLSSGDWPFFYDETIKELSWFPQAWDSVTQYGADVTFRLWIDYPFRVCTKLLYFLGFDWWFIERFYFALIIALCIYSSYKFARSYLDKKLSIVSVVVYSLNTYFLMIFSGGQLGISLAYSFFPLALKALSDSLFRFKANNYLSLLKAGLFLSLLGIFDLRILYILLTCLMFFFIFFLYEEKAFRTNFILDKLKKILLIFLPFIFIHSFWLLPVIFVPGSISKNIVSDSFSDLRYFSFGALSQSLSILHPNWPENIFGKSYFMKPQFLLIPIAAYSFLIVARKESLKKVYFLFLFISLMGAFLAKGTTDPFGWLYYILYKFMPGFSMFRDPTKWYVLVTIAFSILIPFSIKELFVKFKNYKFLKNLLYCFILLLSLLQIYIIFIFLGGSGKGIFIQNKIPQSYIDLKNDISNLQPGRILWIPELTRFSYYSSIYPAFSSTEVFNTNDLNELKKIFRSSEIKKLESYGYSYIALVYDRKLENERNNKYYNKKLINDLSNDLGSKFNFSLIKDRKDYKIYKVKSPKNYIQTSSLEVFSSKNLQRNFYEVELANAVDQSTIILNTSFSPYWSIHDDAGIRYSSKNHSNNLFKTNSSKFSLFYQPQKFAEIGAYISLSTICSYIVYYLFKFLKYFNNSLRNVKY